MVTGNVKHIHVRFQFHPVTRDDWSLDIRQERSRVCAGLLAAACDGESRGWSTTGGREG